LCKQAWPVLEETKRIPDIFSALVYRKDKSLRITVSFFRPRIYNFLTEFLPSAEKTNWNHLLLCRDPRASRCALFFPRAARMDVPLQIGNFRPIAWSLQYTSRSGMEFSGLNGGQRSVNLF
tara:strand:- start:1543 stop:1905 length:363 start_codon:yes stop_codon:yes gene_type:complete